MSEVVHTYINVFLQSERWRFQYLSAAAVMLLR